MNKYWPQNYRSPVTPKRNASAYSHHLPYDSKPSPYRQPYSPESSRSFSPPKRTSSLSKPASRSSSSPRYVDPLREQIDIVPDFSQPSKPRQLLKCKIQLTNHLLLQTYNVLLPDYEPSRISKESSVIVEAYAANTNQGVVRNYNEDRVAIILNVKRPEHVPQRLWKKSHFFGVYDGHGGTYAADFLRDQLHHLIVRDPMFVDKPLQAIKSGFAKAEQTIIDSAQRQLNGVLQKSGSCAIVLLIVGKNAYIANVGDSRAIMSCEQGELLYDLSIDHKPTDPHQQQRIVRSGGKIYQTKIHNPTCTPDEPSFVLGPYRVFPGRLSVTRTFGDAEAKLTKYGGNPNVVIARPEIKYFQISQQVDFIILCSDGVFDKASSEEIVQLVWQTARQQRHNYSNVHEFCGLAVQRILKFSVGRQTADNITAVMVGFEGLAAKLDKVRIEKEVRPVRKEDPSAKLMDTSANSFRKEEQRAPPYQRVQNKRREIARGH